MENLNTDQVLIWVLIFIALGAVAWAALQNWFFQQRNRYNQFPPNFPHYGAYPPYGGYAPQQGGDYPHMQTPRRSSPFLTLLLVVIAGIGLFKWVSGIKPVTDGEEKDQVFVEPWDGIKNGQDLSTMLPPVDQNEPIVIPPKVDTTEKSRPDDYDYSDNKVFIPPLESPAVPDKKVVPETGYSIQVAALEDFEGFKRLATKLRERFPKATIFRHISEIAPSVYGDKLLIGRFKTREAALEGVKKLRKKGYKSCFPVDFEEIDMVEVYEAK